MENDFFPPRSHSAWHSLHSQLLLPRALRQPWLMPAAAPVPSAALPGSGKCEHVEGWERFCACGMLHREEAHVRAFGLADVTFSVLLGAMWFSSQMYDLNHNSDHCKFSLCFTSYGKQIS